MKRSSTRNARPVVPIPGRPAQIHHLDEEPSHNEESNSGKPMIKAIGAFIMAVAASVAGARQRVATPTLAPTPSSITSSATYAIQSGGGSTGTPQQMYAAAQAACGGFPIRGTGTTYYYCDCQTGAQAGCVAGSDANVGTSASAPRQTFSNAVARFNGMNAGDTVAFCKGGSWTGARADLANARCSAVADMRTAANTTTCDLRDYTPSWGGTARPIIRQTADAYLFTFLSNSSGIRVLNLDMEGACAPGGACGSGTRGIISQGHWNNSLVCNNKINGFYVGIHLLPSPTPAAENIDVWGNLITNNALDGYLGSNTGTGAVDANLFDNSGYDHSGTPPHSVYLQGTAVASMSYVNNQITYSNASYPCSGTMLVVHDQFERLNIENNLFDGGAGVSGNCWVIGIDDGGYPTAAYYRNLTVRRNWLQNGGYQYIYAAECPGAIIENNVLVVGSAAGTGFGIDVPGKAHRTGDDTASNVTIRNNTVYVSGTTGLTAIEAQSEGTGHVIANNSVYFTSSGTCFATPLAAGAYTFVGNNVCFGGTWGTTYDATPHVTANPRYMSAPVSFVPAPGSPLIRAGSTTHKATTDFAGRARPSPPAIGAYEPAP
jgi:hypothetical protein